MPDATIVCPECRWPQLVAAGTRTYDTIRCGNCDHPLAGEPVDIPERLGAWTRNVAREILAEQWQQYLDGRRGGFNQAIAIAFRIADSKNKAILAEAFPLIAAAYEVRS